MQTLNRLGIIPVAWWLIWITFHAFYLIHSGLNRGLAVTDSLVSNLMLAALCTGVLFSVRYSRPEAKRLLILITGILISTGFWVWVSNQILSELFYTQKTYLDYLATTSIIRYLIGFFMITLFALIGWITFFTKEQQEEKQRASETIRLSRESELIHLRQQLQPHFLFNTLNSVSALIGSDPVAAKKMILQLSDFLRGTLKKADHKLVHLSEELQFLQLYLEIEKVRFGQRLNTEMNVDPLAEKMMVPVFLLQPLLENAIKFGLYDTLESVTIALNITSENGFLIIKISNPYDSETASAVHGTGFGLSAVSRRLFLIFNRNDLLQTTSLNSRFTATLKIPQSDE